MTDNETEAYVELVRVTVGNALASLSPNGDHLPTDDEHFISAMFGLVGAMSTVAAMRKVEGGRLETHKMGQDLARLFVETTKHYEQDIRSTLAEQAKPAN